MDGLDAALLYQQALFLSPGDRPGDIFTGIYCNLGTESVL